MEELRLKSTIGGGLLCTINLFVEVPLAFKNVWNRIGVFMVEEDRKSPRKAQYESDLSLVLGS